MAVRKCDTVFMHCSTKARLAKLPIPDPTRACATTSFSANASGACGDVLNHGEHGVAQRNHITCPYCPNRGNPIRFPSYERFVVPNLITYEGELDALFPKILAHASL